MSEHTNQLGKQRGQFNSVWLRQEKHTKSIKYYSLCYRPPGTNQSLILVKPLTDHLVLIRVWSWMPFWNCRWGNTKWCRERKLIPFSIKWDCCCWQKHLVSICLSMVNEPIITRRRSRGFLLLLPSVLEAAAVSVWYCKPALLSLDKCWQTFVSHRSIILPQLACQIKIFFGFVSVSKVIRLWEWNKSEDVWLTSS